MHACILRTGLDDLLGEHMLGDGKVLAPMFVGWVWGLGLELVDWLIG